MKSEPSGLTAFSRHRTLPAAELGSGRVLASAAASPGWLVPALVAPARESVPGYGTG